jgi:hypothetical protein
MFSSIPELCDQHSAPIWSFVHSRVRTKGRILCGTRLYRKNAHIQKGLPILNVLTEKWRHLWMWTFLLYKQWRHSIFSILVYFINRFHVRLNHNLRWFGLSACHVLVCDNFRTDQARLILPVCISCSLYNVLILYLIINKFLSFLELLAIFGECFPKQLMRVCADLCFLVGFCRLLHNPIQRFCIYGLFCNVRMNGLITLMNAGLRNNAMTSSTVSTG